MKLFDTHCHLDDAKYDGDLDAVIERAGDLEAMVTVGTHIESTRKAIALSYRDPRIWAAAGVHPNDAASCHTAEAFAPMVELARDKRVVAIGETGLDYYRNWAPRESQDALLTLHFGLAASLGKPLIIHCRDAHDDFYARASKLPRPVRGVMHCFSGTREMAEKYIELGFYISIAGPVTFPNARGLREVVKGLPLDRLLVETDAPYLAPQEYRGKRNEPAYVRYTAMKIAEVMGRDPNEVAEASTSNGRALFALG